MIRLTALPSVLVSCAVWCLGASTVGWAQSAGHLTATARVLPVEPARAALTLAATVLGRPRPEAAVSSPLPSVVIRRAHADRPGAEPEPRPRVVSVEVHYLSN